MTDMASSNKPLNAIVVCGPSGVGKGTLLKRLFGDFAGRFAYSVSHTTRAPRPGEVDGREYHFVSKETILRMRDNNEFLELCEVHGNFYGTSVAAVRAVQRDDKICMIEIDVKGAQKLANQAANGDSSLNATYFFITAPKEELRKRITGRGDADSESEQLQKRLATAETEFLFLEEHPDFFSAVIVNDVLDAAYERLVKSINDVLARHHMPLLEKAANKI